jgi:hypothetical protein
VDALIDGLLDWVGVGGHVSIYYGCPFTPRTTLQRFPEAQLEISTTCLAYVFFDVFAEGYCSTDEEFELRLQQNRFFDSAARHWGNHARGNTEQGVQALALDFLMDDSKVSS